MRGFTSVYKRELRSYFSTPLAYVLLVIWLFFSSFLTYKNGFFQMGRASLELFFANFPLLFTFLVPAIAMRLWAEERRTNTIELLFTLPVTTSEAVLGKFAAALSVLALGLALTFPMVIMVSYLGNPDPGPIIAGYLGSLLMAAAYLGIGSFFSALSRNQVIAFVLAVVACAVFMFAGSPTVLDYLSSVLPMGLVEGIESLSFRTRFESIQRGVIELGDLAFFVLLAAGWLWANVALLEERRTAE